MSRCAFPACLALLMMTATARSAVAADANPRLGFDKLLFVKRFTYDSNHYYTEYINSSWKPGGNLCILDLKDRSVKQLVPQLRDGVFERFDLRRTPDASSSPGRPPRKSATASTKSTSTARASAN